MLAAGHRTRIAPTASIASAVTALFVDECDHDRALLSIPRPAIHLVARMGPSIPGRLDLAAMGIRRTAHRKVIRGGHRTVMARLHLGVAEAVLGVPASALADRIVAIDELWGEAASRRLLQQLAAANDARAASAVLESAIAQRLATAAPRRTDAHLALAAADRLAHANVNEVAAELGVTPRHLRRVFRDAIGVSPKVFAQLARFDRALAAARDGSGASWARIAAASGYYDQAHLIDEFRAITGVTPRALLDELGRAR